MVAGRRVVRAGPDPLGVVDHGGENEDAQRQEDDEQEELVGAGAQRVSQDSEAHEMPRQLEDPQNTHESHDTKEPQNVFGRFGGQSAQAHLQIEWQNGHKVYDVQDTLDKLQLVWTERHTHQELKSEPEDTDSLDVGEGRVRLDLVLLAGVRDAVVAKAVRFVDDGVEGLVCLQAEGCDGNQDEEQRGERYELRRERDKAFTHSDYI